MKLIQLVETADIKRNQIERELERFHDCEVEIAELRQMLPSNWLSTFRNHHEYKGVTDRIAELQKKQIEIEEKIFVRILGQGSYTFKSIIYHSGDSPTTSALHDAATAVLNYSEKFGTWLHPVSDIFTYVPSYGRDQREQMKITPAKEFVHLTGMLMNAEKNGTTKEMASTEELYDWVEEIYEANRYRTINLREKLNDSNLKKWIDDITPKMNEHTFLLTWRQGSMGNGWFYAALMINNKNMKKNKEPI